MRKETIYTARVKVNPAHVNTTRKAENILRILTRELDRQGEDLEIVSEEDHDIIKDKIVVGAALYGDFRCLNLNMEDYNCRDIQEYYTRSSTGTACSIRGLALHFFNIDIQKGSHDPLTDAKYTMKLFMLFKDNFESLFFDSLAFGIKEHLDDVLSNSALANK